MKLLVSALAFIAVAITQPALAADVDFDWDLSSGPNLDATITVGDTVTWTWADALPHTVEDDGAGAEAFSSGIIASMGSTFSHTFTVVGSTDYLCGVHGAVNMGGTITVEAAPVAAPALDPLGIGLCILLMSAGIVASRRKKLGA